MIDKVFIKKNVCYLLKNDQVSIDQKEKKKQTDNRKKPIGDMEFEIMT